MSNQNSITLLFRASGSTLRKVRTTALASVAFFGLFTTNAWAIDVASEADWSNAVAAVAAAGANSTVNINFTNGFTLTSSLAQIQAGNANVTVNISGNNKTIDGSGSFQGLQISGINAPTVNISGLAIANTTAVGGAGQGGQNGYYSAGLAYGAGGGGGGGLGAGGGLFIGSGANVTISAVTFTGTTATGGAGGAGGVAQNSAPSGTGGNGGDGGTLNGGSTVGGGGLGGSGGNAGTQGTAGSAGASLGAGGGGGGGSGTTSSTTYTSNNSGGAGNTGGGNGNSGGDGVTNNGGSGGPGADGGFGGAGGAARGGAIYVATGATLTVIDTGITGANVTGGAGGAAGTGQGPSSFNGSAGAAGLAAGSALYISGVQANIGVSSGTVAYSNTIAGTGLTVGGVTTALNKTGAGVLSLSGTNSFTGNVNISGGTLSIASTSNLGVIANDVLMADGTTLAVTGTTTFASGRSFQIAGTASFDIASGTVSTIQGVVADGASAGNLLKTGNGQLLLSGTNTYSGTTQVSGGILRAGSANAFGASNVFVVAAGAILDLNGYDRTFNMLSGSGTVSGAASTISGTFAPGNGTAGSSMNVTGNLTFQPGSKFSVQVNPAAASSVAVTGAAALGGATVLATYENGSYVTKKYTILTASAGLGGTTFGTLANTNLPAGFTSSLSYDANNAYLNIDMAGTSTGLSVNQQNVSNALVHYYNSTGGIPLVFGALTPTGLTQVSGELATGSQQSAFVAMSQFMGVLTDPFVAGRSGSTGSPADQNDGGADLYEPRWRAWATAFGGTQSTNGNATLGANNVNRKFGSVAGGVDIRPSADMVAGFALAGGGSGFNLSNGLGSGRSDTFQAGAFLSRSFNESYVTGTIAYGWQDITTERTVTAAGADRLRAEYMGNAFSGRLESGYRFETAVLALTPYVAGQFAVFILPSYTEKAVLGANTFALSYGAKNVPDTLSEIGVRLDRSLALQDATFTLRGRAAWVHDYTANRDITATFLTLPGATFGVNGAKAAQNAALATAAAEWKWNNGFMLAGTVEGLFSSSSTSYAGKIIAGYQW